MISIPYLPAQPSSYTLDGTGPFKPRASVNLVIPIDLSFEGVLPNPTPMMDRVPPKPYTTMPIEYRPSWWAERVLGSKISGRETQFAR